MKRYDWAVIGSGIAGISIAEILSREGHNVILIEKNSTLASETTREFHEWLHTGALYTLVPTRDTIIRFILGAIDDLIEYYSSFDKMNIIPTINGLKIDNISSGWFNDEYIHFNFRIKNRKIALPWIIGVARSIYLMENIHNHDWLRRRAGEIKHNKSGRSSRIIDLIIELYKHKELFKSYKTSDFTINSRNILRDLIATSIDNGLEISLNNNIKNIKDFNDHKIINGSKDSISANNIVICTGAGLDKFTDVELKTSYAPIAVVSGVPENTESFVELDYFPKNCINLLKKENGFGLAGGISFSDKSKCNSYLDYVINRHKVSTPTITEESRYIGVKTEARFKNQPRNYLYNIVNPQKGTWVIVPGKFTLAFSLAPEFYRRVYKKNPQKHYDTVNHNANNIQVSNTVWMDELKKKGD